MVLSAVYRRHNAAVRYWSRLLLHQPNLMQADGLTVVNHAVAYRLGSEGETRSSAFVGT